MKRTSSAAALDEARRGHPDACACAEHVVKQEADQASAQATKLVIEQAVEQEQSEVAFVMGGLGTDGKMSSMERFDVSSGKWRATAAMSTARNFIGACEVAGELFVTGGMDIGRNRLSSMEKFSPSAGTWSTVAPLPTQRSHHSAVAVGSVMYVCGGSVGMNS
jgi:hypothetical protein